VKVKGKGNAGGNVVWGNAGIAVPTSFPWLSVSPFQWSDVVYCRAISQLDCRYLEP
jgi:hypothetical protein